MRVFVCREDLTGRFLFCGGEVLRNSHRRLAKQQFLTTFPFRKSDSWERSSTTQSNNSAQCADSCVNKNYYSCPKPYSLVQLPQPLQDADTAKYPNQADRTNPVPMHRRVRQPLIYRLPSMLLGPIQASQDAPNAIALMKCGAARRLVPGFMIIISSHDRHAASNCPRRNSTKGLPTPTDH